MNSDDWPEINRPGSLASSHVRALDAHAPCQSSRSVHHCYHRDEPIGCRNATWRWHLHHGRQRRRRRRSLRWWSNRWPTPNRQITQTITQNVRRRHT